MWIQDGYPSSLSSFIQRQQNVQALHMGSHVFCFWLSFLQFLDSAFWLHATFQILEPTYSWSLYRLQKSRHYLRSNERLFGPFHCITTIAYDMALEVVAEGKNRTNYSFSNWGDVFLNEVCLYESKC